MAENTPQSPISMFRTSDLVVPVAILTVLAFMLFPMPALGLDLGLAFNLTFSLVILMVTLYTVEPLQFSSFPSLLLITTLIRLGFNVAATRRILGFGNEGEDAAGFLIKSFGSFVGGNDAIVGFVVFLILIVIQFVVITSGAQRVSEVAARFTLDAMPGKQMAIDADLNQGLITEQEARARREKIAREANFYGAMDGASKFVRGDAIAAIVIIAINIIGGFVIGLFRDGGTVAEVARTYTLLTIGEGLVTQIPALIVATSTGLLVTRSASEGNMGKELTGQIFSNPRPLAVAGTALALMALFFPGWSKLPLIAVAGLAAAGYTIIDRSQKGEASRKAAEEASKPPSREPENVTKLLAVDPMELEIGLGLIPLVEEAQGGDLLDRITMIRRQTALELGLVVPPIRIRDNMQLGPEAYVVKIRGTEISRGELAAGRFLAINSSGRPDTLPGIKTKEPTFGLPAVWIEESLKSTAERQGYTVVDPPSVVATHLTELIRSHAHELLTRQDTQKLVDTVKATNGAVVEELIPGLLTIGDVQKVLQNLLKERVGVRDLTSILEALADNARATKDTDILTEKARAALYRTLTRQHLSADGAVHAVTLDPRLEQGMIASLHRGDAGTFLAMEPRQAQRMITALSKQLEALARQGHSPLVLCSPAIRLHFKRLVEKLLPNLAVLSYNELDSKTEIQSAGTVSVADENTPV